VLAGVPTRCPILLLPFGGGDELAADVRDIGGDMALEQFETETREF
jgi:hypothetical protein